MKPERQLFDGSTKQRFVMHLSCKQTDKTVEASATTYSNFASREECEMAEIANLTGETEDNVRAILSRSRKKLKEMFLKKMNHGL